MDNKGKTLKLISLIGNTWIEVSFKSGVTIEEIM